ncbi:hypothetical protein TWF192_005103 [Orbilia oligospora]|uniref:Uncharacterized protein n=1 Tax=Orbilia oligospora TaxID=2813651 RepID=A0A6G1M951_ORBOL|nr:hypothetical protein TWF191_004450 [Orbilia oligospora]KAF3250665.1 hypothetical protein TWF192_005103 [Orbilia oligospora]
MFDIRCGWYPSWLENRRIVVRKYTVSGVPEYDGLLTKIPKSPSRPSPRPPKKPILYERNALASSLVRNAGKRTRIKALFGGGKGSGYERGQRAGVDCQQWEF